MCSKAKDKLKGNLIYFLMDSKDFWICTKMYSTRRTNNFVSWKYHNFWNYQNKKFRQPCIIIVSLVLANLWTTNFISYYKILLYLFHYLNRGKKLNDEIAVPQDIIMILFWKLKLGTNCVIIDGHFIWAITGNHTSQSNWGCLNNKAWVEKERTIELALDKKPHYSLILSAKLKICDFVSCGLW